MAEATAAYLDCTAGVAGDMMLGALLDAGADLDTVRAGVRALGITGLELSAQRTRRGGLACTQAMVAAPVAEPGRGLAEVDR
ncbi:MAG TPA: nickel insertion protein, partial [Pseudonocardiaceae bacterium]|nr:nickel insertion protein [Pseudonocardiaceae bacterium]